MYRQVIRDLRRAYDQKVDERDQKEVADWKKEEREVFLDRLRAGSAQTLLEIGAGPGVHGKFFQEQGLEVICTDLSPAMVARCREKGLPAYTMDFLNLDFPPGSFDAVFAINCLLHVPKEDLPSVLAVIHKVLKPGGLFYLGQYGGEEYAGELPEDHYRPKRFYSFLSDQGIREMCKKLFELLYFKSIPLSGEGGQRFQSLISRRKNL